jgi:hypothetical protein
MVCTVFGSAQLQREAMKQAKDNKGKLKKNLERNNMGDTTGRVHMQHQDMDDFQVGLLPPNYVLNVRRVCQGSLVIVTKALGSNLWE